MEELSNVLGQNALLEAQVNRALASHLLKLESLVSQGNRDSHNAIAQLQSVIRDQNNRLDQLSERVAANGATGGRIAVPAGNDLWLTRILDRFVMYLETRDMSVSPRLVLDGYWEKAITDAFTARLRSGLTVVDVGANYGYYSLLAGSYVGWDGRSSTGGKVYAFEPNPRTFEILTKNIRVNWLTPVVQAHRLAVLDARKQIELHVLREFQGGTSVVAPELVPEENPWDEQRLVVDAAPLDEIVTESVDLMKVDAEGSEPLVYEGMRGVLGRSPRLTVFMEFSPPMLRQTVEPKEFLNRIRNDGFSLQWFTPWGTLEPFAEERALEYPMFNLLLERN